jgi:hypothetical protein
VIPRRAIQNDQNAINTYNTLTARGVSLNGNKEALRKTVTSNAAAIIDCTNMGRQRGHRQKAPGRRRNASIALNANRAAKVLCKTPADVQANGGVKSGPYRSVGQKVQTHAE